MSKKVKNLIEKDLSGRLKDIDGVAVINPRGIGATKTNLIRRRLRGKRTADDRGQEHAGQASRWRWQVEGV